PRAQACAWVPGVSAPRPGSLRARRAMGGGGAGGGGGRGGEGQPNSPSMAPCVLGDAAWTRSASVGRRLPEPPANAPPAPSTQPCPRPAVLRPAGARPAGARPLAGASPCLRRTRDLPLEAEAAARSSRGNIDGTIPPNMGVSC
ncbi:unnamed protein product, partial [Prorocentrum cordatum]